jgi:predicted nucleic acid-binding protein
VDAELLVRAASICNQYGLMVNDALIVATMLKFNIQHLVTNDDDFDRVHGIHVWKPR